MVLTTSMNLGFLKTRQRSRLSHGIPFCVEVVVVAVIRGWRLVGVVVIIVVVIAVRESGYKRYNIIVQYSCSNIIR